MFDPFQFLRGPRMLVLSVVAGTVVTVGLTLALSGLQGPAGRVLGGSGAEIAALFNLPNIPGISESPGGAPLARRGGMAGALPPGRDGWTRRGWQAADGDALIAASLALPDDAQALGADVVGAFLEVAGGEMPGVLETYARGGERIVVMLRRLPVSVDRGGLTPSAREAAVDRMVRSGVAPLAVHGVAFASRTPPVAGETLPFESLSADVAGQILVRVATNADRAALVGLLSGLDVAGLNRFADTPDPLVSAAKGVATAPGLGAVAPAPVKAGAQRRFGDEAPVAAAPEVTRGTARAADPVAGEAETAPTGICIRRAGVRTCN